MSAAPRLESAAPFASVLLFSAVAPFLAQERPAPAMELASTAVYSLPVQISTAFLLFSLFQQRLAAPERVGVDTLVPAPVPSQQGAPQLAFANPQSPALTPPFASRFPLPHCLAVSVAC